MLLWLYFNLFATDRPRPADFTRTAVALEMGFKAFEWPRHSSVYEWPGTTVRGRLSIMIEPKSATWTAYRALLEEALFVNVSKVSLEFPLCAAN